MSTYDLIAWIALPAGCLAVLVTLPVGHWLAHYGDGTLNRLLRQLIGYFGKKGEPPSGG